MKLQRFSLKPFRGENNGPIRKTTGTIERRGNTMSVACALLGNLSELAFPLPEVPPERRGRLWEETCLEFFLGEQGSERYWEFNLSPAGHWNVFRFASYRKEMREEPAFTSLPLRVRTEPEALRLSLDVELGKILPAERTIEVAVGAVIKTIAGQTSHWALVHPGPRPDFHRRDGFTLNIPAE
ncbi:MAG: DOMON-like domain-containing protein [Candidatus Deferrimicrobiaceae bacterium]